MYICYIDEAGDAGMLPSATANGTPVLVLAGVILDRMNLHPFTLDFLNIKQRFFPAVMAGTRPLAMILREIKGADVRKSIRAGGRNERRHAINFLGSVLSMLEKYDAKIVARILVKRVGNAVNETKVYTSYMQAICYSFQQYLESKDSIGLIIADSRVPKQNETVSYSIFTQKFKRTGDDHSRVLEMPTFGHSTNHAGIQVADIVASTLLFPMAAHAYSTGHVNNVHVSPRFEVVARHLGDRVKALQFRYPDEESKKMRGGITVSDEINQQSAALMFRSTSSVPATPKAVIPVPTSAIIRTAKL
jgi:hypothetical protein